MSSLYNYYSKVTGESAFLSGVISTLCDEKLIGICPRYWTVEADIFKANKNNICNTIKQRLYEYLQDDEKVKEHIERLDFELQPVHGTPYENFHFIIDTIKERHHPDEKRLVDEFFEGIEFQLGKMQTVYKLSEKINKGNIAAISDFYIYTVFEILFVEYKDFMVMIVFGTDE